MDLKEVSAAWQADTRRGATPNLLLAVGPPCNTYIATCADDVCQVIDQAQAAAESGLWVVGGVSYEAAPVFDAALCTQAPSRFPLAFFHAYAPQQVQSCDPAMLDACVEMDCDPWLDQSDMAWYTEQFERVQHAIEQGEFYQLNLTTRLKSKLKTPCSESVFAFFLKLYQAQPARQSVFLRLDDWDVLSLSPELFFEWDGCTLLTSPMKGTRKPSRRASNSLRDSEKDLAENVMVVDLLRNDMARVCRPGSVHVRSLFDVMSLPTVEQMTSTILGQTREDATLLDVFKALFPCGSVTGAPKVQAMKRIAQWEASPRNLYCGALGVINPSGHARFNVPIRTLVLDKSACKAIEYGVGSGVTWYSNAQDEKREWWQKTAFLRQATQEFEVLETVALRQGEWVRCKQHLDRMARAAHCFSFVFDRAGVQSILAQMAQDHSQGAFRGRWLLSAEGRFEVVLLDPPKPCDVVTVELAGAPMACRGLFVEHKTTLRAHYEAFVSSRPEVFDTVLFDTEGHLTESCRANLVLDVQGVLYTPLQHCNEACNLLPGVYRAMLLGQNKVLEKSLTVEDLCKAQAMWLINSLREWVAVACVLRADGTVLRRF